MQKLRNIVLIIALLTFVTGAKSTVNLLVITDYAAFYDPALQQSYVEFYYSIYRHQLEFIGSDTSNQAFAGVFAQVNVYDMNGEPLDSASNYFLTQVEDTGLLSDSITRFFDYLAISLAPGSYLAEISVIDDVSKVTGTSRLSITIPDFAAAGFALSDLEMAYDIRESDGSDKGAFNRRLVKEDRLVVPNPSRIYQLRQDSVINVYCELYGLAPDDRGREFVTEYQLKDSTGGLLHDFGEIKCPRPGPSAVLSQTLNISGLEPGEYNLSLRAYDPVTEQEAISVKSFYLYDSDDKMVITDQDVEELVNVAWYHLSEAEKIQIRKLGNTGKLNFLEQFWREMDDDPTTPENPFYKEILRRYYYAIDHYSTHSSLRDGWKTDRGRVYITYGPYDDRIEVALPVASMPLIKWEYYSLENGVIFIFASDELAGADDYRLVHSTHPHEIYNSTWMDILRNEVPEENFRRQLDEF